MMSSNCLPKREIRGATWVYINGLQLQLKKLEVLLNLSECLLVVAQL